MTKQELLKTLSEEQLNLLGYITDKDVMKELKKRKLKTSIEIKIGDCFVYRNDCGDISLIKVMSYIPENHHSDAQYFYCAEINIDSHDIDMYEMNYYINDFAEYNSIDSEIFDKIAALVNSRDNAMDKICKEFDKQIRELCSILLNTQNKN
jgi:hypothetical protein